MEVSKGSFKRVSFLKTGVCCLGFCSPGATALSSARLKLEILNPKPISNISIIIIIVIAFISLFIILILLLS